MDQSIKNLSVILLIAGSGRRISNVTRKPKCLIELNKQSILYKNLSLWKKIGLKKIHVVLGYKSKVIENELKIFNDDFKIIKSFNKQYQTWGNSYSLLLGLNKIKGPVIIFDGDLIYDKKILISFLKNSRPNSILIGPGKPSDVECAKVLLDKKGGLKKIIDKESIFQKKFENLKFIGEAIGIIKLSKDHVKKLKKSLKIFLSIKGNLNLNWEKGLNYFLQKNKLNYFFTKSQKWIEIDDKKDISKALKLIKKYKI